jgi:hypothetical protein
VAVIVESLLSGTPSKKIERVLWEHPIVAIMNIARRSI